VADEKHSWWLGQRIYIAVTAAKGCFLGVSLAMNAGAEALTQAYGVFHAEAILESRLQS
jgi:ribulose kinase